MTYVYVIQDTPETEAATVAALGGGGFASRSFRSSEALVGAARVCRPDLVVAPLKSSELGGNDVVLALRADARTRGVRIVLIGEAPVDGSPHAVAAGHSSSGADAADGARPRPGDVAAALELVEAALAGEVTVAVMPFARGSAVAMSPYELAGSLEALVRGVAENGDGDRNVQIVVTHRTFGDSEASAVGVLPGTYVLFDIERVRSGSPGAFAGRPLSDPKIGLSAARAAVVRAGGSMGLSRASTGGAHFTAYVPTRVPAGQRTDPRVG